MNFEMPNSPHPLTLFIVKKSYGSGGSAPVSTGLRTSAGFVVGMLQHEGLRAKLVEAVDGNCIDRLISEHRPARVVLEAIWVTPEKMAELMHLHPKVRWTVRVHSHLPFLANEGMAVAWLIGYMALSIEVAFNSYSAYLDFKSVVISPDLVAFLPNYYPLRNPRKRAAVDVEVLDVGCFGAIRPMKNQLIQAVGAIRYANSVNAHLRFHMNGNRSEQGGDNALKNIRALFAATSHELVLHPWMPHEDFLELIASMDACLQVSLSETFNIVSADSVSMGVPLIGSEAIDWLPKRSQADVDSAASIAKAMQRVDDIAVTMNHAALETYLEGAVQAWMDWF